MSLYNLEGAELLYVGAVGYFYVFGLNNCGGLASLRDELEAEFGPAVRRSGLHGDGGCYVIDGLSPISAVGIGVGELSRKVAVPVVWRWGIELGLGVFLAGLLLERIDESGKKVGRVLLVLLGDLFRFSQACPNLAIRQNRRLLDGSFV